MTKIIVTATHKGGEGKTTNSIVLSEYCARVKNLRTLAIDLDSQANLSSHFLDMEIDPSLTTGMRPPLHPDYVPGELQQWNGRSDIAGIFFGEEVIPYPTKYEKLDILPAHSEKLDKAQSVRKNEILEKVYFYFQDFVSKKEILDMYDCVIIDTPPNKLSLTISAIKSATHLIIPCKMEDFSLNGIYSMLQLYKQETYQRSKNRPLNLVGILPTQFRQIQLHKRRIKELKDLPKVAPHVLDHTIGLRTKYGEMISDKFGLFDLPESESARIEYGKACETIMEKILNG